MRRPFRLAIAMKTLVELMRRHPELRLIELHPCQYDCLGLWHGELEVLCQFNVGGSSLLFTAEPPRSSASKPSWWQEDLWRYPQRWLASDLVEEAEERMGLKGKPTCPPRPHTVSLGVVAELCARLAFTTDDLHLRAGWYDTSGMGGSSLTQWCPPFTETPDPNAWQEQARWGTRFWALSRSQSGPRLMLDLKTGAVQGGMDLWGMYKKGAGIREMAWELEREWRGLEG